MKTKGLAMGDDGLCATVTDMLLVALRSLAKRQAILKLGEVVMRNGQLKRSLSDREVFQY
jgi:hypothetical protein